MGTWQLTVITGASRGLGLALAEGLLKPGHRVLTLSRHLAGLWVVNGADLVQWDMDLGNPLPVASRLEAWLHEQDPAQLSAVTLIHNAAMLPPPAPLERSGDALLSQALRVDLEAPLLLSAAFLRATSAWTVPRRLLFISSGIGRTAMAGAALYGAAKAGLDHLARALALEQAEQPNGAHVVSLAPGVIDTAMQSQLRDADPAQFTSQGRFADMQREGRLVSPQQAAAQVLAYLARPDYGSQPVADVRQH